MDANSSEGNRCRKLERNSYLSVEWKPGWLKIKELKENQNPRLIAATDTRHLICKVKRKPSEKNYDSTKWLTWNSSINYSFASPSRKINYIMDSITANINLHFEKQKDVTFQCVILQTPRCLFWFLGFDSPIEYETTIHFNINPQKRSDKKSLVSMLGIWEANIRYLSKFSITVLDTIWHPIYSSALAAKRHVFM